MKTRKITYALLQVRNGAIWSESAERVDFASVVIGARLSSERGFASLVVRKTFDSKGRFSSGRVCWASADMVKDRDVLSAPQVFIFEGPLVVPSYVKAFGRGSFVNAEAVAA